MGWDLTASVIYYVTVDSSEKLSDLRERFPRVTIGTSVEDLQRRFEDSDCDNEEKEDDKSREEIYQEVKEENPEAPSEEIERLVDERIKEIKEEEQEIFFGIREYASSYKGGDGYQELDDYRRLDPVLFHYNLKWTNLQMMIELGMS